GGGVVAAFQSERDELFARLQRLAAEFDNLRKRNARGNAALTERANERLVKELIPILDDLGRALEAAAEHEEAKLEEGVRLVHRSLATVLGREGLAEIETEGTFDPHVHEALLSQPSELDEGAILQVIQKGYRLGDRVIEVQTAYDLLSDTEKRKQYDRFGANGRPGFGGANFNFGGDFDLGDLGDIFGGLFGGARGGRARQERRGVRGDDLEATVNL